MQRSRAILLALTILISLPLLFVNLFVSTNLYTHSRLLDRLTDHTDDVPTIPNKSIYILWLQGIDQAPLLVKRCVHSWRHYNPDWKVVLLDQSLLMDYLSYNEMSFLERKSNVSRAHYADIVRVMLLERYGGVWADATTFCNRPLNEWLPQTLTHHDAFFAFERPGPDRMLSNWFLYAKAGGYIIRLWKRATIQYYVSHASAHTYFIQHYLFADLYESDIKFRTYWNSVKKMEANNYGPHYLLQRGYFTIADETMKRDILSKETPLYKLSWQNITDMKQSNSLVGILLHTIPYADWRLPNASQI
jgi:hypothetical protein